MKGERTVEKRRERNTKKTLLDIYSKYGIILILILIMAFLTIRTGGTFIGKNNLLNILKQIACIGVLACGQTAVIIAGGMGGGMNMDMIQKAQKMQQDLLKMQEEMESKEYEASAGGGVITAVVSGKRELVRVNIDPEAVDPDDVEMLQDMIVAAVNEAMRKAEADSASSMSKLTGGLNLGGLF